MRRLAFVAAILTFDLLVGAVAIANEPGQQREMVQATSLQEPVVVTTTIPATIPTTTNTVAPTTTSPPAPPPTIKAIRAPVRAEPAVVEGDIWEALARCESGMINVTSGSFKGYFQFLPSTWHSVGETGMPYDYSYAVQKAAAQRLVARSGWGQFPACSRKIGAR